MKLFPKEEYTIQTFYSVDVVKGIMKRNMGKKEGMFSRDKAPFYGEIGDSTFRIKPNIDYRNSFLPVITGQITEENGKSNIKIKMELEYWIKALTYIYLSFIAIAFLVSVIILFKNSEELTGIVACVIMLAFMMCLIHLPFNYEARKRKKQIDEMFYITVGNNNKDYSKF